MKTMTCSQMGGPCDAKITGSTPEEMMKNAMQHAETAHPDMAAKIKATPQDDPMMISWNEKFKKDWASAPETK
jgi:predicted small metal-binding protein